MTTPNPQAVEAGFQAWKKAIKSEPTFSACIAAAITAAVQHAEDAAAERIAALEADKAALVKGLFPLAHMMPVQIELGGHTTDPTALVTFRIYARDGYDLSAPINWHKNARALLAKHTLEQPEGNGL